MKRKLFALLLSALAISLLMGAGVEESDGISDPISSAQKEELYDAPVEEPVNLIQIDEEQNEIQATEHEQEDAEPLDSSLLLNGQPVPMKVSKFIRDGVTFVSLKVMSQLLDPAAQVSWDESGEIVTIDATQLKISAEIGKAYLIANGRYLYAPEGILLIDGQSFVSLKVLAKAFCAQVDWDENTQTVHVTTSSDILESGDTFYNSDELFWLSRLIFAESGGQTLQGQLAVGTVVMNRVKSDYFPDSILSVISQRNQFSTYRGGKLAKRTPSEKSVIAAKLILDGAVLEEVADAYFFDSARSSWASRNKTCVAVIGAHRFFDY